MDIQQASIYSGVSESTLRRWIVKAKKLRAEKIDGKYEIDAADLDRLLEKPAPDSLAERISNLESRIGELESRVEGMSPAPRLLKPTKIPYDASAKSDLPDGWVPLTACCEIHGIPESTVRRHIKPDTLKRGKWMHGDKKVQVALDLAGQNELWELFHTQKDFTTCAACPHDDLV